MPGCTLKSGSRAVLLGDGELRYQRKTHDLRDCSLESGSTIRIYTEAPSEREADRILTKRKVEAMEEEQIETVEEIPVSAEIEQATTVASDIGGWLIGGAVLLQALGLSWMERLSRVEF